MAFSCSMRITRLSEEQEHSLSTAKGTPFKRTACAEILAVLSALASSVLSSVLFST